jgi:hypothetical protein
MKQAALIGVAGTRLVLGQASSRLGGSAEPLHLRLVVDRRRLTLVVHEEASLPMWKNLLHVIDS